MQITEGGQIMTASSFTPQSTTSTIFVIALGNYSQGSGSGISCGLFESGSTDALDVVCDSVNQTGTHTSSYNLFAKIASWGISAKTFSTRVGFFGSASTLQINSAGRGARTGGGALKCQIRIMEIEL